MRHNVTALRSMQRLLLLVALICICCSQWLVLSPVSAQTLLVSLAKHPTTPPAVNFDVAFSATGAGTTATIQTIVGGDTFLSVGSPSTVQFDTTQTSINNAWTSIAANGAFSEEVLSRWSFALLENTFGGGFLNTAVTLVDFSALTDPRTLTLFVQTLSPLAVTGQMRKWLGGSGSDNINLFNLFDSSNSVNVIYGNAGADVITTSSSQTDTVYGGDGPDSTFWSMQSSGGSTSLTYIDGGAGYDWVFPGGASGASRTWNFNHQIIGDNSYHQFIAPGGTSFHYTNIEQPQENSNIFLSTQSNLFFPQLVTTKLQYNLVPINVFVFTPLFINSNSTDPISGKSYNTVQVVNTAAVVPNAVVQISAGAGSTTFDLIFTQTVTNTLQVAHIYFNGAATGDVIGQPIAEQPYLQEGTTSANGFKDTLTSNTLGLVFQGFPASSITYTPATRRSSYPRAAGNICGIQALTTQSATLCVDYSGTDIFSDDVQSASRTFDFTHLNAGSEDEGDLVLYLSYPDNSNSLLKTSTGTQFYFTRLGLQGVTIKTNACVTVIGDLATYYATSTTSPIQVTLQQSACCCNTRFPVPFCNNQAPKSCPTWQETSQISV